MKRINVLSIVIIMSFLLSACDTISFNNKVTLDSKNPVTVTIWHYYNGAIMNAFETMIKSFNESIGEKEGIIVEGYGIGSLSELEKSVMSSANKEVGSMEMPNIFTSYADTAYEAEKMNILANLGDYFTEKEQNEYLDSYIQEGKIGLNGELRIFPIVKTPEILMINETDWLPFANANGLTYDNLTTMEDITQTSEIYYNYTDNLTPEVPNDGKSFFGRDSMANLFIIASKGFGTEIFHVERGKATLNINKEVMRKIWDNYYVPYISGYFSSYGRFRSDDAKVGDIIAYIGATSSASYFPTEVTADGNVYSIDAKILPVPHFKGAENVIVQQGAGMVVTKNTAREEYASVVFLKWFTEVENNIRFTSLSGYTPVKKAAINIDLYESSIAKSDRAPDDTTNETLKVAYGQINANTSYTNKAFEGGAAARSVLEHNLQDKAVADRATLLKLIEDGSTHEQAVSQFNTEDNFNNWLEDLTLKLNEAIKN